MPPLWVLLPRVPAPGHLEEARAALTALAFDVGKLLIAHDELSELSGTSAQSERQIQNSNPENPDFEPTFGMVMKTSGVPRRDEASPMGDGGKRGTYPLGLVLNACPDVADFAREEICSWRDLADTAEEIRPMLGISPDTWRKACEVMGDETAAVTVAAIL
ncbi:replication initiation protein RepC [Methylobacterium sp. WL93]|uniref:replication initiation protein RepC n=1 Tax=Methylobacterium sp. WL93 TaxID=2603892 RepID=UPI0032B22DF6